MKRTLSVKTAAVALALSLVNPLPYMPTLAPVAAAAEFEVIDKLTVNGDAGFGTSAPATKLDVNGAAQFGLGATKSTFTATPSNTVYALSTSSGINVAAGGVTAAFFKGNGTPGFFGNGAGLTNVIGTDSSRVAKAGDFMTGQLTIRAAAVANSSMTITGALGVGGAGLSNGTLVVKSTSTTAGNPVLNVQNNAGTGVLRVQQDGYVGIGTQAPAAFVHLAQAPGAVAAETRIENTSNNVGSDAVLSLYTQAIAAPTIEFRAQRSPILGRINSLSGYPLVLQSAGDLVGIGTTAPATTFDVNGAAQFGLGATKSTFTATPSNTVYALSTSSGVNVAAGGVTAAFFKGNGAPAFFGNGAGLTNVTGTDSTKVAKAGDTMTGQLTIVSSQTVTGAMGVGVTGASNGTLVVKSTSTTAGNPVLNVQNNAGTQLLRVQQNGYVGIGTAGPSDQLDVAGGNIRIDNNTVIAGRRSGDSLTIGMMGIDTGNFVVLGPLYSQVPAGMKFSLNGAEKMRIDSAGKVGMATTSPAAGLDVNDSAQFGLGAWKSTFTATPSNTVYALSTSSGINVAAGGVKAPFFDGAHYGSGVGLTSVTGTDASKVAKIGDTMTGQLTIVSSLTVTGAIGTNDRYYISGSTVLMVTGAATTGSLSVGPNAGPLNTGDYNVFVGSSAGAANSSGLSNTFIGYQAGLAHTTSSNNTFLGYRAGANNTSGSWNTAVGMQAGSNNTSGFGNAFMGTIAGWNNTSGSNNAFMGRRAGQNNLSGSNNSFLGSQAGDQNTGGMQNSFMGTDASYNNTSGSSNTAMGFQAGYTNSTGGSNVFLGFEAGYDETGSNKLYIANSRGAPALIYGDFAAGRVGISTQTPATSLDVNGDAQFGSGATKSTFTATPSNTVYALRTSSGINVAAGGVTAAFFKGNGTPAFFGNGAGLTNVSGTDSSRVAKAGDFMTGQLTIRAAAVANSSMTITGALGVGGAGLSNGTLVVKSTSTTAANPVLNVQNNAGTELVRIQQDGKVGIGTASPGTFVHIAQAPGAAVVETRIENLSNNVGSDASLGLWTQAGASPTLQILAQRSPVVASLNANWGPLVLQSGSNRVGIGTTAPATKLDVEGDASFGSGAWKSTFTAAGVLNLGATGNTVYALSTSSGINVAAGGVTAAFFKGNGTPAFFGNGAGLTNVSGTDSTRVLKAGDAMTGSLTVIGASVTIQSNGNGLPATSGTSQTAPLRLGATGGSNLILDFGTYTSGAAGTWLQSTNRTSLATNYDLLLNPNGGKVGVGTTAPAASLDVNGNAQFGSGATKSTFSATGALTTAGALGVGGAGLSNGTLVVKSTSTTAANPVLNVQNNAGTQLFRVQQNGNVGIGTTPSGRLDVLAGAARSGTHATSPSFYVTGTMSDGKTGTASGNVEFRHDNATQGIGFGYNTIYQAGTNTNQDLNFLSKGSSPITLNSYASYSTGGVGIGSLSPAAKLHVSSGSANGIMVDGASANGIYVNNTTNSGTGIGLRSMMVAPTSAFNVHYGVYVSVPVATTGTGSPGYSRGIYSNTSHASLQTSGQAYAIHGVAGNASSGYNIGVIGELTGTGNGAGVQGTVGTYAVNLGAQYAGYFNGNTHVQGNLNISGALTKGSGTFTIDHPLDPKNKILQHSFVESPDMKNLYDDVVALGKDGTAVVTLPAYFEALNKDYRYLLTALGSPAPGLYIKKEIADNSFTIAGGKAGQRVSWQVTGTRKDKYAEAHRVVVEQDKGDGNVFRKGEYMHPEAW